MFNKEATVHAAYSPLFEAACMEMGKEARITGAREPAVMDGEVPYEIRKKMLMRYAAEKANEGKSSWLGSMGGGALIGGGLGAAMGGLRAGAPGAAVLGLGGAGSGALLGALAKISDDRAIRRSQRMAHPDADTDTEVANRVISQKRMRELGEFSNSERRHADMMGALRR